jgi:hypothetical protein
MDVTSARFEIQPWLKLWLFFNGTAKSIMNMSSDQGLKRFRLQGVTTIWSSPHSKALDVKIISNFQFYHGPIETSEKGVEKLPTISSKSPEIKLETLQSISIELIGKLLLIWRAYKDTKENRVRLFDLGKKLHDMVIDAMRFHPDITNLSKLHKSFNSTIDRLKPSKLSSAPRARKKRNENGSINIKYIHRTPEDHYSLRRGMIRLSFLSGACMHTPSCIPSGLCPPELEGGSVSSRY